MYSNEMKHFNKIGQRNKIDLKLEQKKELIKLMDLNRAHQFELDRNAIERIKDEFIEKTDKRSMYNVIQNMVNDAKLELENDLNRKRERLRQLLQTELEHQTNELIQLSQQNIENEKKGRVKRLMAQRDEEERERIQFLETKRMQQILDDCDEIRPQLRKSLLEESKLSQLHQIEDNKKLKAALRDRDKMWQAISDEIYQEKLKREKEEQELIRIRNLNDMKHLQQQIAENEAAKRSQKATELAEDPLHRQKIKDNEEQDNREKLAKLEKKMRIAEDIKMQLEENVKRSQDIKNRQSIENENFKKTITDEIAKEQENLYHEKKQFKHETLQYLAYLRRVQQEKTLTEREKEQIIEDIRQKIAFDQIAKDDEIKAKRKAFEKAIHEERWRQICDRKQRERNAQIERLTDQLTATKTFEYYAMEQRKGDERKQVDKEQYRNDLKNQMKYEKMLQKEEQIKAAELLRQSRDDYEQRFTMAKTYVRDVGADMRPMHPNLKQIYETKRKNGF